MKKTSCSWWTEPEMESVLCLSYTVLEKSWCEHQDCSHLYLEQLQFIPIRIPSCCILSDILLFICLFSYCWFSLCVGVSGACVPGVSVHLHQSPVHSVETQTSDPGPPCSCRHEHMQTKKISLFCSHSCAWKKEFDHGTKPSHLKFPSDTCDSGGLHS